jgi:hypothetical protein
MDWFTTTEGAATLAFITLVLLPFGKRIAKRTKTLWDDHALTWLERALAILPFTRRK